ncbi:MAG TPA: hypothetical protein VIE16_08790 [Phenylobacterium sp.]
MTRAWRNLLFGLLGLTLLLAGSQVHAKDAAARYPSMAAFEQYQEADTASEIALARSAAPAALSNDAEILVLGRHGFEAAVKGKNGFVCLVERSWINTFDFPEFWNPKIRSPTCYNPAAARSILAAHLEQASWVLGNLSMAEMQARAKVAVTRHAAPPPSAMCYMMSKQGYLEDAMGHAAPHLMFFLPHTAESAWGANLAGSPVRAEQGDPEPFTVFYVTVSRWSDGTPAAH